MTNINDEYILETFFVNVPDLGYSKKIYACMPETSKECPVLYMHDGHNLFLPEDSFNGSTWQAKNALNELYNNTGKHLAIIGIGADHRRFDEYSPWQGCLEFEKNGGLGDIYLEWIIKELIPLIRQKYNFGTRYFMAGSSMGGYISMYAGYKYRNMFEKVGLFSPAFWFNFQKMETFVKNNFDPNLGMYLDVGKKETSDVNRTDFPDIYLSDARKFHNLLNVLEIKNIKYLEDEEGQHSEKDWAKRFPGFLNWLLRP